MRKLTILLPYLVIVLLAEGAARIYVAIKWPPAKVSLLTEQSKVRGRYTYHERWGYALTPGFDFTEHARFTHGALAFRGPDVPKDKSKDTLRIAGVGGSTTYGVLVNDDETHIEALARLLRTEGFKVDVINGGVPGWSSAENLASLKERVLPLRPDLVVIYQGRNDIMPQAYNNYRSDYSHFRAPLDFASTNATHKKVYRLSHLLMVLGNARGRYGFGWDMRAESPLYNSLVQSNLPTDEESIKNLENPKTAEGFYNNTKAMVAASEEAGAVVLLSTFALDANRYASGALPGSDKTKPAIGGQLTENNNLLRRLAKEGQIALAETSSLTDAKYLPEDGCHMNAAGHQKRAELMMATLKASGGLEKLRAVVSQP